MKIPDVTKAWAAIFLFLACFWLAVFAASVYFLGPWWRAF